MSENTSWKSWSLTPIPNAQTWNVNLLCLPRRFVFQQWREIISLGIFYFSSRESINYHPLYWNPYKSKRVTRFCFREWSNGSCRCFWYNVYYRIWSPTYTTEDGKTAHAYRYSIFIWCSHKKSCYNRKRLTLNWKNVKNAHHSKRIDDIES